MKARALLSGGIGAGKSTAAALFSDLGAAVVSADDAGHRVLAPGGEAEAAVATRWPDAVVDGIIDRRSLGRLVFAEPSGLSELEAITHPAIGRLVRDGVDAGNDAPLVMVEVPLPIDLFGPGWPRVVVDAPEDIRIFRMRLRGMEPDEIAGRMAAQPLRDEWLALADHVIDNSEGPDELASECRRVWLALVGSNAP